MEVTEEEEKWNTKLSKDHLVQYEWLNRARKYSEGTMIFGEEKNSGKSGSKTWWCGSINKWTDYVFKLSPEKRFGNCVIFEDEPIFGFADLEFMKEPNQSVQMNRMVHTLITHQIKIWKCLWPDKPPPNENDYLILTASDSKKESKHLHGPFNYAFKNIYHLKAYYTLVLESLAKTKNDKGRAKECLIKKVYPDGKSTMTPFVDMIIYHHKSCFRMYKCTKVEYYRPMEIDAQFELPSLFQSVQDNQDALDRLLFRYCIPSAVPPGTPILSIDNDELITSILPKNAFNYDVPKTKVPKLSFVLFKHSTAVPSANEATHIEVREDEIHYRKVTNKSQYYDQLATEKFNMKYFTWEIFTEETILVFRWSQPTPSLIPQKNLEDLQKIIYDIFAVKNSNDGIGYILAISDREYHIYWPKIKVKLNSIENIYSDIKGRLISQTTETEISLSEKTLVNCYIEKKVPLLGSCCKLNDQSQEFRVRFVGCFGNDGIIDEDEVPDKRTLLDLLSVNNY